MTEIARLCRIPAVLCLISLSLLIPFSSLSAQEKVQLREIRIQGNLRVEEDGIRLHLKARPGDLFDPSVVDQDVKAIYRMGFFDEVKAELSPEAVLTYLVKEKPYIKEVKIQGNSQLGARREPAQQS